MNIAIIGAGNMGGATALGLAGALPDVRITVTAKHSSTLEKFAARGLQTSSDNAAAARGADIVVIGVKPWLVAGVLEHGIPVRPPGSFQIPAPGQFVRHHKTGIVTGLIVFFSDISQSCNDFHQFFLTYSSNDTK